MLAHLKIVHIVDIVDIVDFVDNFDIVDVVKNAHTTYCYLLILSIWYKNLDGFRGYVQSKKRYLIT